MHVSGFLLFFSYFFSSQYVFVTESVSGSRQKTVHEELAQQLKAMLNPAMTDQLVVLKFLKHSWFFFDVISKSMAQHLLSTERIKVSSFYLKLKINHSWLNIRRQLMCTSEIK